MKLSPLASSHSVHLLSILLSLTIAVPVDNEIERKWAPVVYDVVCGGRFGLNYYYCGQASSIDNPVWINTTICETECRCTNCGYMICNSWFHCDPGRVRAVCMDHAHANCMCQRNILGYKEIEENASEPQSGKNFPQPDSCVE